MKTEKKILNNWGDANEPLVSICCIAYNHENYIEKALKGFLMQETSFPFEIIIHDDASPDNTANIIKDFEKLYPKIIKPLYQTENQRSKFKGGMNPRFNYPRAKGNYIALCDGDDYWTDPLKLQKQVDFLEDNPEYSLTVGGYSSYNVISKETKTIIKVPHSENTNSPGYTFSLDHTQKKWLTKTLTSVFKNDKEIFNYLSPYKYLRDVHLFYHLLKSGKGYYFTEKLGVYQIHEGGVHSMKKGKVNNNAAYNVYKELYEINRDEWTRQQSFRSTIALFNYNLYNHYEENTWRVRLKLYMEAIKLTHSLGDISVLFLGLLSPSFKNKIKFRV